MDFYVVEVASGLKFIEANQHQRGVTNTIGALYKEYYGQEMKWLTFKRNQMLWEDIPDSLKDRFIIYGKHARTLWPNCLYAIHHGGDERYHTPDVSSVGDILSNDLSDVDRTDLQSVLDIMGPNMLDFPCDELFLTPNIKQEQDLAGNSSVSISMSSGPLPEPLPGWHKDMMLHDTKLVEVWVVDE